MCNWMGVMKTTEAISHSLRNFVDVQSYLRNLKACSNYINATFIFEQSHGE